MCPPPQNYYCFYACFLVSHSHPLASHMQDTCELSKMADSLYNFIAAHILFGGNSVQLLIFVCIHGSKFTINALNIKMILIILITNLVVKELSLRSLSGAICRARSIPNTGDHKGVLFQSRPCPPPAESLGCGSREGGKLLRPCSPRTAPPPPPLSPASSFEGVITAGLYNMGYC